MAPEKPAPLVAVSLSRDPFADIGRAVSEFDAVRFDDRQELHSLSVDQLEFGQLDGDDTAVLERGAKYIQFFPCNPSTDVQHRTLGGRKSVDSERHFNLPWPVCSMTVNRKRRANRKL